MRYLDDVLADFGAKRGDLSSAYRGLEYVLDNVPGDDDTDVGLTLGTAGKLEAMVRAMGYHIVALETRLAERALDTERLDAIERGDVDIECMGTTVRYFNLWNHKGVCVTASPSDSTPLTLREALDRFLTPATPNAGARV